MRQVCYETMISAGLDLAIPGSVRRCLIHWAMRPDTFLKSFRSITELRSTGSSKSVHANNIW